MSIRTLRAVIDIVDAENNVTGHELEYHIIPEGEEVRFGGPQIIREEATPEEVAAIRAQSDAGLTAANRALNQQIADERKAASDERDALIAAHAEALALKDAEAAPLRALVAEAEALSE